MKRFDSYSARAWSKGILLLCLLFMAAGNAWAGDKDHERARQLRESGAIMPLEQLLDKVKSYGRVLEVELKSEHGRHVYEIEFLDAQGEVRESYFDARSGEPLPSDWKRE
jgi:uncharacterized membrane protein YkoI